MQVKVLISLLFLLIREVKAGLQEYPINTVSVKQEVLTSKKYCR